jgi:tripartite-type tricarboxylate transporter receptor subunit TctC
MIKRFVGIDVNWAGRRRPTDIQGRHAREGPVMTAFRYLVGFVAIVATTTATAPAAQDAVTFPTRSVRLIVPSSAGGPVDAVARVLADALRTAWRETIVVESKPGAGNSTGAIYVAQSPPDGHTLLVISDSITINPSLYPNLDKDPLRQFEAISVLVTAPQLLVARPDLGAANLREFIGLAKVAKNPVNVGSAGIGTISHLTQVLLEQRTGITSSHIPFRGAAPAVTAVMGGHVDAAWVMPAPTLASIAAGKLKALAVTSAARDPRLPAVATAEESGLPNFQVMNWQGLFAPATTPKPIVDRIAKAVTAALKRPEVVARLAAMGFETRGDGPGVAANQVRTNVVRWSEVLRKAGIKAAGN